MFGADGVMEFTTFIDVDAVPCTVFSVSSLTVTGVVSIGISTEFIVSTVVEMFFALVVIDAVSLRVIVDETGFAGCRRSSSERGV